MSRPDAPPPTPTEPAPPAPRPSLSRRALTAAAVVVLAALAIVAMIRYTRRVDATIVGASASGEPVKLLRDRVPAPLFAAPDLNGRQISMAALRGKVVLVNFWATWCPPCREEIPELIALQSRYKDQLQIIGIAQDSGSAEDVAKFAASMGMNYPIVIDTPEIDRGFPPTAYLPTSFLIDRDGRIAQKHVGMLNASLTETETRALAGLDANAKIEYVEDDEKARLASAAQANKIPGVDLNAIPANKRGDVLKALNEEHCTCGCELTIAQCRLDDPSCGVSLPLAEAIVKKIASK
ncbi:MAG: TlpA disulfide reductase family protein [Vicinamibacterales bacterium]